MADISAIGSALVIDERVLNRIKEADDKLVSLQKTADETAKKIGTSFKGMSDSINPFLAALDNVITKLGSINTAASNAGSGLSRINTNVGNLGSGVSQATQGIVDLVNQLSQIGGKGASGVMQAVYAFQRLQESMKGSSGMNIAQLTEEINNINTKLTDTENLLTKSEQDALVKRRALLQNELKEQQRTYEERVIAFQSAIDRMTNAQAAYNKKQQQNKVNTAAQATEKEIEQLEAKFRNMKAPDFGQTYEKIQQLKAELKSVKEEFSSTLAKIIEQDNFKAGKTNSAPALKKGEYQEMQHSIGVLGDKERSLQAEIDALTEKIKKENAVWREQRQALAENIEMLKNLKAYKSDSTSLDEQRSKNTLAEMRQYYKELEVSSRKAVEAERKAADEADKIAERWRKRMEKISQSTGAYGQQYHNDRQSMYEKLFSAQNTTAPMALANSASAKTLREHTATIKELQQARLNLDTTDKNYKQNLEAVNNAIKQHSKALRDAGVNARSLGEQTSYLSGYVSRLAQRTAVMFSMSAAKGFVEQIAEVRGQFELSERSLEAILQNKPKADEIFNKTVELAVKSPFRIKDLVDYTRQLSAYRIQSDKLYDTTKRLADVSAGLGVDMGRLILAYGQVKAAAYLRGSEVRQFTEAGINMYGELQSYFKEVKGEAYTTAQIVDMISKRKVTFKDVEAIFQRMTDKGGTFYNMQEIQAETLQGKISNLKDAFDVMLNDIGKENQGTFTTMIDLANSLLKHWRGFSEILLQVIAGFAGMKLKSMGVFESIKKAFSSMMTSMKAQTAGFYVTMRTNGWKAAFADTFKSMGAAIKSMGAALKSISFVAILQGLMEIWSAYSKYSEAIEKANSEYVKEMGYLSGLRDDFNNLTTETNNAADAQKRLTNNTANLKAQRTVLQTLIDKMNQQGFDIKINVDTLNEKELKNKFEEVSKEYEKFQRDVMTIQKNIAENSAWNAWYTLSDDINEDAKDYTNAALDILAKDQDIDNMINKIKASYDDLNATSKEYYKILAAGRKEGESDLDYYQRMVDAINNISKAEGARSSLSDDFDDFADKDIIEQFGTLKDQAKEFENELDKVMGYVKQKGYDKQTIKLLIDRTAADHEWSQYAKEMAYKHFDIPLNVDKKSVMDEMSWVDLYIADFFKKKRYGIKLSVNEIENTSAADEWLAKSKEAAEAAKKWKEVYDQISKKNGDAFPVSGTLKDILKGTMYENQNSISKREILAILKQRIKESTEYSKKAFGVNPFEKEDNKAAKQNAKEQRDILQERISLIKDMNSKYNELIKTETKEAALSKTRKYFKEAAQNVGWSASNILPDDNHAARQIENLAKQYKEVSKKGNGLRVAADIDLNVSQKEYDKLKEDISRNIDETFSELDLYKKLKNEGLSDGIIKNIFGDITTSFDDLQGRIDDEFNKYITRAYEEKYGKDYNKWGQDVIDQYNKELANTSKYIGKYGEDVDKAYKDKTGKVNEKIKQDTIDTFSELTKAYKTQLSDQLQLDKWYIEERNKIQTNADLQKDPELKQQYQENLDKQYKQKTDENTWKGFQNSDMYIRIFDNLEHVSGKVLKAMEERLQSLRENLKNLDPTQLKAVVDQLNKVSETRNSRNPFRAFTTGLKEMVKYSKQLKQLGGVKKYISLSDDKVNLEEKVREQNKFVEAIQQEYDAEKRLHGVEDEGVKALSGKLTIAKGTLKIYKEQLKLTDEQIAKLGTIMTAEEQAKSKFAKSVNDITSTVSAMANGFKELFAALGGNDAQLEHAMSIVNNVGSAIASYYSGNYAGVVAGALGVATGIVNIVNDETKIDEEIKYQERIVSDLQHSYEKLKKAMDDAFKIEDLQKYNQQSIEMLEKQKEAYNAMLQAEASRKNSDESKLQEYRQKIEDLDDTIKELKGTLTEELGGFGSESNYKAAAEAFAEAWVDAFNEGSDSLEALNDKFDEYIQNLITKQATQRVVGKLLEPLLKEIDNAVSEGSEGGNNGLDLTSTELGKIKSLGAQTTEQINETLTNLAEVLNFKGKGSASLSSLQQGIQSVTEATAQALESILNSMRYYLAQQQADVRTIRDTLLERLGSTITSISQDSASSPILVELRLQTGLLTDIRDTLDSCVKTGHKQGRSGIKVFMN